MISRPFTVIYEDCNGIRRELYLMAQSVAWAAINARELLPSCVNIVRCYHDPSWNE
jgi:hypothetical protein